MVGTAKDDKFFTYAVEEAEALLRARRGLKFGEKKQFWHQRPGCDYGYARPHSGTRIYDRDRRPRNRTDSRRDSHYEYHARERNRAHMRNRCQKMPMRATLRHYEGVPERGDDPYGFGWTDRIVDRLADHSGD